MSNPIAIHGFDHIVLRVQDKARMLAFYCDVLGCTVAKVQEKIGLVQLQAGAAMIDLVDVNGMLGKMGGPAPGETALTRTPVPSTSMRSVRVMASTACFVAAYTAAPG